MHLGIRENKHIGIAVCQLHQGQGMIRREKVKKNYAESKTVHIN